MGVVNKTGHNEEEKTYCSWTVFEIINERLGR